LYSKILGLAQKVRVRLHVICSLSVAAFRRRSSELMFAFPNPLMKPGRATNLLEPFKIQTLHEAVSWMWKLPYGRTSDRSNYLLVPVEQKGACSAKHAFLAEVAAEQSVALDLYLGIFMMDRDNTPRIGAVLTDHGLQVIPEAHRYLRFQDVRYDFTSYAESKSPHPHLSFIHEEKIAPAQIGNYKTEIHRGWLESWARRTNQKLKPEELWAIRERCIAALSG
jgi:hypothetical protein